MAETKASSFKLGARTLRLLDELAAVLGTKNRTDTIKTLVEHAAVTYLTKQDKQDSPAQAGKEG